MKLYETMRNGENLGWCRCFVSDDNRKAIAVNEGEIVGVLGLDSNVLSLGLCDVIDAAGLVECGCADCPFRDDCEAMNLLKE